MASTPIKFGTDGWRAIIADTFTFDNVRICAQAVADYLKASGLASRGLVIGFDTRFASEDFARICAEVAAGNGVKVYLSPKAVPTPVVSFGVTAVKAGGAIMITASHNPGQYNGFKYKTEIGGSAPDDIVAQLEKNVGRIFESKKIASMSLEDGIAAGKIEYLDISPLYIQHIGKLVDIEALRRANLNVVIDSMYGAGAGYLKILLSGGKAKATEIHGERNPLFPGIKPEPIAPNLTALMELVRREKASVGMATDGDADRLGLVDEKGTFLTTLQVFALLCLYLLETRGQRGLIIKTITNSSMIYQLGELYKVPVKETAVGFKYVAPIMVVENALIGGEESGGFGYRDHIPERDGILSALYFLDFMVKTGKSPSQLLEYLYSKVGPHYYDRVDIEFDEKERKAITDRVKAHSPKDITGLEVTKIDTFDGFRFMLADNSWLLIRFSGTEPLLRIYSEAPTPERVQTMLNYGKKLAGVK